MSYSGIMPDTHKCILPQSVATLSPLFQKSLIKLVGEVALPMTRFTDFIGGNSKAISDLYTIAKHHFIYLVLE